MRTTGQSLPPPGLVGLGVIDAGLIAIAAAGNHSRVTTVELAD